GFREPITRERLLDATRTGEVEGLVNWMPVKAGETYYIPAHTVHAIGGGIVLFEIQQNSDVTYRLWDYGRPREIHVDQAVPISALTVPPGAVNPVPLDSKCERLVPCPHFVTERCRLIPGSRLTAPAGQFWLCLDGEGDIAGDCY